jgi:CheY-like chemotaxis protein
MPSGSRRRPRKVLVVEDHDDTRSMYREHFARAGYVVETATGGNEALALALSMVPDVILLDLAMPRLDGWDTTVLLRTYPTTARIPIVACTAVNDEEALERVVGLGCTAVIRKPCLPVDIEIVIDRVLDDGVPGAGTA